MNTNSKNIPAFNLIELSGRLDQKGVVELENHIDDKMRYGSKYFVIDMSELKYLNSSAIRILIKTQKQLKLFDGYLTLVNPTANVLELLKLSELETLLRLKPNIKEAIKEFI